MTTFSIKWINAGSGKFNNGIDETGEYQLTAKNQNEAKRKFNSFKGSYYKTYPDTKIISVRKIK